VRAPRTASQASGNTELQLAPLIDCVFLLLTYFLFTISLSTIEGLLPSEIAMGNDPQQRQLEQKQQPHEIVIRIIETGRQPQYFIDDWPVADFENVAQQIARMAPDSTVVIDAGDNVAYGHVVRVYNQCLRSNIHNVLFPVSGGAGAPGVAPRS
jgi:biopolymer transport protein ExbD